MLHAQFRYTCVSLQRVVKIGKRKAGEIIKLLLIERRLNDVGGRRIFHLEIDRI